MFGFVEPARKILTRAAIAVGALALSACDLPSIGPGGGPKVDTSKPVQVALLLPKSDGGAAPVAASIENAARLAVADLKGAKIDLRVYDTAGNAGQAAGQANRAIEEGAKIIIGPLFAEAANAVGVVAAPKNVNVLAFSNNPTIAGIHPDTGTGVFVLGPTFNNTANRLAGYMTRNGKNRFVSLYSNAPAGLVGHAAVQQAVAANGGTLVGSHAYPFSQQGIAAAGKEISGIIRNGSADAVFMTADPDSDLPFILTALPDNGINSSVAQFLGLTRWNVSPQIHDIPGANGGIFALPNQQRVAAFEGRYQAAYGSTPHALGGLGYDAIAAIGALVEQGRSDALSAAALTQNQGFQGSSGPFRLRSNGLNERPLAIAQIQNKSVVILEAAPDGFRGAGF